MTLGEHLGELRRRVIICVIAFVIAGTVAVVAYEPILHFLLRPLCNVDASTLHHTSQNGASLLVTSNGTCNLFVTSPLDGLTLRVKIALFGGLVLASPVILFQIWRFVTPGLKASERRYAVPFVVSAFVLFLAGAATAYLTLPARAGLAQVGGRAEPQGHLRPDPVPGPDPAHDDHLRAHLRVPGGPGLPGAGRRGEPGAPAARRGAGRSSSSWWSPRSSPRAPIPSPCSPWPIPLVAFYFLSIGIGKLLGR